MSQSFPVSINRCWRHRGDFSLRNFFVIGRTPQSFSITIMPLAYFDRFLPEIEKKFAAESVVKWAEGEINPRRMTFYSADYLNKLEIREILRNAFLARTAEQRLDQFLNAEVYIEDESLNFTIASLAHAKSGAPLI